MKRIAQRKAAQQHSVQQPVRRTVQQSSKQTKKEPERIIKQKVTDPNARRLRRKMEEEPKELDDYETSDSEYENEEDETMQQEEREEQEEIPMDLESEKEELKEKVADKTTTKFREDDEMYQAIKKRYNELVKKLWESQGKLEEFGFSQEERDELNERERLFLEYFVCTAAFREDSVNLFEYIDTFTKNVKFL